MFQVAHSVLERSLEMIDVLTYTCVGIHPGRVEPASPIALTTSRTEALQARRSCALRGTASPPPALLVQRRLRWFDHATRRPEGDLIKDFLLPTTSHMAQTSWRPAEDMGNHDQGRPGTALRTESFRPRMVEKGLSEFMFIIE